ncbi:hypothetical protein BR93DRAFT_927026 [Coniochaeta sp. PMI_546]|nr:hypothetical protein BR93DRAFT_927026 [Coniochaeta sp. PMI_546]
MAAPETQADAPQSLAFPVYYCACFRQVTAIFVIEVVAVAPSRRGEDTNVRWPRPKCQTGLI